MPPPLVNGRLARGQCYTRTPGWRGCYRADGNHPNGGTAEVDIVTSHDLDEARAPPPGRHRTILPPEDDPERLAIMTIDGERSEADAREMMRSAPT